MLFHELNRGNCTTYVLGCESTRRAALIDPVRDRVDRYLGFLAYHGHHLELAIDTHTPADHRTGTWELRDLTGARTVMHKRAPAPNIDVHVDEGDRLPLGRLELRVLSTPELRRHLALRRRPRVHRRQPAHPRYRPDRLPGR